jgi:hypothetical protein
MIFFKPNIARLKEKKNIPGLVNVLLKPKLKEYHKEAAFAVAEMGSKSGIEAVEYCYNNKTISVGDYITALKTAILHQGENGMPETAVIRLKNIVDAESLLLFMKDSLDNNQITKDFYIKALLSVNSESSLESIYRLFMGLMPDEQENVSGLIKKQEFSSLPCREYWCSLLGKGYECKMFKGHTEVLETVLSLMFEKDYLSEKAAYIIEDIADEGSRYLISVLIQALGSNAANERTKEYLLMALKKIKAPESFVPIVEIYPMQYPYIRNIIITALTNIDKERSIEYFREWIKTEEHPVSRAGLVRGLKNHPTLENIREHIPRLKDWINQFTGEKFKNREDAERAFEPIRDSIWFIFKFPEKDIVEFVMELPEFPEQFTAIKEKVIGRSGFEIEDKIKYFKEHKIEQGIIDILIKNIHRNYVHALLLKMIKNVRFIHYGVEKIIQVLTRVWDDNYAYLRYKSAFQFLCALQEPYVSEQLLENFDEIKTHKFQISEKISHLESNNPKVLVWRALAESDFQIVSSRSKDMEKGALLAAIKEILTEGLKYNIHFPINLASVFFETFIHRDEREAYKFLHNLPAEYKYTESFWALFINRTKNKEYQEECRAYAQKQNEKVVDALSEQLQKYEFDKWKDETQPRDYSHNFDGVNSHPYSVIADLCNKIILSYGMPGQLTSLLNQYKWLINTTFSYKVARDWECTIFDNYSFTLLNVIKQANKELYEAIPENYKL